MLVGNVHFVRGRADCLEAVAGLLRREGVETTGNPDLYVRKFGSFGIDEARQLCEKAAMRAVSGGRRYFVVAVDAMTPEAQNALLKTLEDAPGDAMFIFIHPAPQTLLPTVRSRAQMLSISPSDVGCTKSPIDADAFLRAAPAKRLDMLKPILEKDDDDRRDYGAIIAFLSAIEKALAQGVNGAQGGEERLHAIYRARRYIGDRGALVKPLLEQMALLV